MIKPSETVISYPREKSLRNVMQNVFGAFVPAVQTDLVKTSCRSQ